MNKVILLSYAFAFSELALMLLKRSSRRTSGTRVKKGSLILLWITITLGFTGGFLLSGPASHFWMGFGSVFLITGLIIRWIAILQLGKSFTVDVAITDKAQLKTDGIYTRVRHPSYLGILIIVIGFSAAMNSFYSFLVLVFPVFLTILYRISIEEELLTREYGSNYIEYRKNTKKIIPGIY
jgi:protein-S-isoprenylcysteine O-methyltransferase Ste14